MLGFNCEVAVCILCLFLAVPWAALLSLIMTIQAVLYVKRICASVGMCPLMLRISSDLQPP